MKTLQEKREYQKRWRAANPDYKKKWYQKNQELIRAANSFKGFKKFENDKQNFQQAFITISETMMPYLQLNDVRQKIKEFDVTHRLTSEHLWIFKPESEILLIPEPELNGYTITNNNQPEQQLKIA